jgi:hypothetical protein
MSRREKGEDIGKVPKRVKREKDILKRQALI